MLTLIVNDWLFVLLGGRLVIRWILITHSYFHYLCGRKGQASAWWRLGCCTGDTSRRFISSSGALIGQNPVCFENTPIQEVTGSGLVYRGEALEKGGKIWVKTRYWENYMSLIAMQFFGDRVAQSAINISSKGKWNCRTYWINDRFHELCNSVWERRAAVMAVAVVVAAIAAVGTCCGGALLR